MQSGIFRKKSQKVVVVAFLISLISWHVWWGQEYKLSHSGQETKRKGLPEDDYSQLIDLHNFSFIKSHPGCDENLPKLVIIVVSAPRNYQKRRVVRETWGSSDPRSILLFFIGAFDDPELEDKIDAESKIFGDIIQANFKDTYHSLTYKHVAVLKWFIYNCQKAKFLLKTDDDVFINIQLLYEFLDKPTNKSREFHKHNLIFCDINWDAPVERNKTSKFYISKEEFPKDVYDEYCLGYAVLYSADAALKIYQTAQSLPHFWIEDVHITGTVRMKANLSLLETELVAFEPESWDILAGTLKLKDYYPFILGYFNLPEKDIRKLWRLMQEKV